MKTIFFLTAFISSLVFAQNFTFRYETTPSSKPYKFCFVGDTGTGEKGQKIVAKALEKENCHEIRILGDLIYPNGIKDENDSQLKEKFFSPYQDLLKRKNLMRPVMGNHDHRLNEMAWIKVAEKNRFVFFPNLFYAEIYQDGLCFLNLDTESISSYLLYRQAVLTQLTWLKEVTSQFKSKCLFSVVVSHHPYVSSGEHGNASGYLKRFLNQFVIGKTDLFISGHDHHLSDEGIYQGTTQLISGAGAKLRTLTKKPHGGYGKSNLGYIVVLFSKGAHKKIQARYEFIEVDDKSKRKLGHKKQILGQGLR